MPDASEKFAATALHPLQRAWDKCMITAWQNNATVGSLLQDFATQHNDGTVPGKDSGLKRLPMPDEIPAIPVRTWMGDIGFRKLSDALFNRNLFRAGTPIPQGLLDGLANSSLDCTKTAEQGRKILNAVQDHKHGKRLNSVRAASRRP